jgi:2-haloalkanoic acid dehalogenase type II
MRRAFDIVTFDCYGTLIDWEAGITAAFRSAAGEDGVSVVDEQVLRAHAEIEPAIQATEYRPYRDVLAEVALRTAQQLGWGLSARRAAFLADSLPAWQPFPDTNAALERLAAEGYKLGILSNIDDDLLADTLRHFSVPFDLLVTAGQVRSYKPAHAHFVTARGRIGERRWLHAARSYFHDVAPAVELGVPVAWVNREGDPALGEARPDVEVGDLLELVEWCAVGQ